jgi:hypothetical protein
VLHGAGVKILRYSHVSRRKWQEMLKHETHSGTLLMGSLGSLEGARALALTPMSHISGAAGHHQ